MSSLICWSEMGRRSFQRFNMLDSDTLKAPLTDKKLQDVSKLILNFIFEDWGEVERLHPDLQLRLLQHGSSKGDFSNQLRKNRFSGCGIVPGLWRADNILFVCFHHYWSHSCWPQMIEYIIHDTCICLERSWNLTYLKPKKMRNPKPHIEDVVVLHEGIDTF